MELFELPKRQCQTCQSMFSQRKGEKPGTFSQRIHCDDCDTGEKINRPTMGDRRGNYRSART